MLAGGKVDDSVGYFVEPTVLVVDDPADEALTTEYFGPILAVHVYEDAEFDAVAAAIAKDSKYALTGAIIAQDRQAVASAAEALRFAAGNFYVNDKPTGAVVGQQPFGGSRASGTNDKAGARRTCSAGPRPGRSRRRSSRPWTGATRTWADQGPALTTVGSR